MTAVKPRKGLQDAELQVSHLVLEGAEDAAEMLGAPCRSDVPVTDKDVTVGKRLAWDSLFSPQTKAKFLHEWCRSVNLFLPHRQSSIPGVCTARG